MSGNGKHYWRLLAGVAALGLASLACSLIQQIQKFDCEASGGSWQYNEHFHEYYCENAGSEYNQKYFPTSTPIASPTLEVSPFNTQETLPTETTPPISEPSPTSPDSSNIAGLWHGTGQWLCDNNPIWSINLEFKPNGIVFATVSTTTDTASATGSWDVSGNEISIRFERGFWIGTITGNTISGTFAEENCSGIWSVTKE